MRFFVGLHQPSSAKHVDAAFISVNRLRGRKGPFVVGDWIMDSGAFTEIATHGRYRHGVEEYAAEIRRWSRNGRLLAAVAQDYMCESHMLAKTAATNTALLGIWPQYGPATHDQLVHVHQVWTIERYDALVACDTGGVYIMPVLQGYTPEQYVRHIEMYGDRLKPGMWVGVGSVCKRNSQVGAIEEVLLAIQSVRPDLRLHGFGVKTTALSSGLVRDLLFTADSMAWSHSAASQAGLHIRALGRELGRRVRPAEARAILADRGIVLRDANDVREALRFADRIRTMPFQGALPLWGRREGVALDLEVAE